MAARACVKQTWRHAEGQFRSSRLTLTIAVYMMSLSAATSCQRCKKKKAFAAGDACGFFGAGVQVVVEVERNSASDKFMPGGVGVNLQVHVT